MKQILTQPESEKFRYVSFPQAITWNNLPITYLNKDLHKIDVKSEQNVAIGKWICDKSHILTFKLLPVYDSKQVLNHENFE